MAAAVARYWQRDGAAVVCELCPHSCRLLPDAIGRCGVRQNQQGTLRSLAYGRLAVTAPMPIETKGLYHFAPGATVLAYGTRGCNLDCGHCQNWLLSHVGREAEQSGTVEWSPQDLVARAIELGCSGLAATFNEPTVQIEFALEVGRLAHEAELFHVWKTNGFISLSAVPAVAQVVDAVNIDLKGWDAPAHQAAFGCAPAPARDAANAYAAAGVRVELTTLLSVRQLEQRELERLSAWILSHLGADTPWHLPRWHAEWQMADVPAPSAEQVLAARTWAIRAGHRFVYSDAAPEARHTECRICGAVVLRRSATGSVAGWHTGRCECGAVLPIDPGPYAALTTSALHC